MIWSAFCFTWWMFLPYFVSKEKWLTLQIIRGYAVRFLSLTCRLMMNIGFSTFTLLGLFYAQLIGKALGLWKLQRFRSIAIFLSINILFYLAWIGVLQLFYRTLFLVDVIIFAIPGVSADAFSKFHILFVSIMYFCLSAFLGIYGWKLWRLVSQQQIRVCNMTLTTHSQVPFLRGKLEIIGMTVLVVLIFTSRAIKDFLGYFNVGKIPIVDPCVRILMTPSIHILGSKYQSSDNLLRGVICLGYSACLSSLLNLLEHPQAT